jgi:hypothetical protein
VSAPALRRPARGMDVARAYLRASAPAALVGIAAMALFTWPGTKNVTGGRDVPFVELRESLYFMLFLPLLHWRGRGGSRALDQGLPMADARQEWTRAACGGVWAVLTLGVALGVHLFGDTQLRSGGVTVDPGLPVSILGVGVGTYLLGSAVLLRTDRPGRVLLLTLLAVFILGTLGEPLTRNLLSTSSMTELVAAHKHVSVPGWKRTTALALVLGLGAMGASTLLGRRGDMFAGLRGRWMAAVRRGRPAPRVRTPPAAAGPRHAAGAGTAVLRQFAALRGRLGWSALIVLGIYVPAFFRLPMAAPAAVEWAVGVAAGLWPALVWLDERGRRDWDESVPVGRLPLRLAHALAGAAWLMITVLPGALIHPAGMAVPAAALATYLASTALAALLGRPVLGSFVGMFGIGIASFAFFPSHPLSLARALAPLDTPNGISWSPAASLVWLALLTAAAVAALHLQARRDGSGSTWFPRLRREAQPA